VAGRALVWSNPEIIALSSSAFIPVAENSSYLQRQADAKGEFFRLIAEQGHYGGRTVPSATRQGTYASTPEGHLLASINTREADKMLAMMQEALEHWQELPAPPAAAVLPDTYETDPRYRRDYPEEGLVLKVFSRDLPREVDTRPDDWRREAVNTDHAWFTHEEALSLLPPVPRVGDPYPAPSVFLQRLARFHLIDNVRGETPMWRPDEVCRAEMTLEVTDAAPDRVDLRLDGAVRNVGHGTWAVRPFREKLDNSERGYDCRLVGFLRFDRTLFHFTRCDVLAVGTRWGGSEHNVRWDDLDPAPMAVAFEMAGKTPADRTPPQGSSVSYWEVGRAG
jgi:hypothetical protein